MKSTYLRIVLLVISFAMLLSFASCGKTPDNETTAGSTDATTAPAETTLEESTTAQPTEAETTLKIETSEVTEAATTEVQTTEKVTETESETLTDIETVTETVTETETETESESEETFPETNLILGEDVEYASEFSVSNVFDSDMVIQRNEFVRVWGWGYDLQCRGRAEDRGVGISAGRAFRQNSGCTAAAIPGGVFGAAGRSGLLPKAAAK